MHSIRNILKAVWKFLFVLLITTESKRPVVHAGNQRRALVPGSIVIEDIKAHVFRQVEFFKKPTPRCFFL